MDIREISPGLPWRSVLDAALNDCTALLAVIGPGWLNATDAKGGRRLEDSGDTLRREVAEALRRGVRVFPLLVNGANMPAREALPDDLRDLGDLQGHILTVKHWREDVAQLIATLRKIPVLGDRPVYIKRAQASDAADARRDVADRGAREVQQRLLWEEARRKVVEDERRRLEQEDTRRTHLAAQSGGEEPLDRAADGHGRDTALSDTSDSATRSKEDGADIGPRSALRTTHVRSGVAARSLKRRVWWVVGASFAAAFVLAIYVQANWNAHLADPTRKAIGDSIVATVLQKRPAAEPPQPTEPRAPHVELPPHHTDPANSVAGSSNLLDKPIDSQKSVMPSDDCVPGEGDCEARKVSGRPGGGDVEKPKGQRTSADIGEKPNLSRQKEPLEAYDLDSLRFVGQLMRGSTRYGLIKTPDNNLHRVKEGDHMGRHLGVITRISEGSVTVKELLNARGDSWVSRMRTIELTAQ